MSEFRELASETGGQSRELASETGGQSRGQFLYGARSSPAPI